MLKSLLSAVCVGMAVVAPSAVCDAAVPFKTLPGAGERMQRAPQRQHQGITVNRRPEARRVAKPDPASALFWESFEDCYFESDVTPEDWFSESHGEVPMDAIDHWIGFSKSYADYNMFAPPADGDMMFGIYYNDDAFKDEWLISPEVEIPNESYALRYFWYTTPFYLYVIDSQHVDFETGRFINREIQSNVEVLIREVGGEWVKVYDLESQFAGLEYDVIADLDYVEMQLQTIPLADYAGKTIQIAWRYWGKEGNSFFIDAVHITPPLTEVSYEPDLSRLFYGYSPDENCWWMPMSLEFYPVNAPVRWYNTSWPRKGIDFTWKYYDVDDNGTLMEMTSTDCDMLEVTYRPDYSSEYSLRNNFYPMPGLTGRGAEGGVSLYDSPYAGLQAGGAPEFEQDGVLTRYTALPFDILTEGFDFYMEGDDQLGFYMEPIFGYSVNTDAWWEHHCFPDGRDEGKYAYVDGYADMFFPSEAPLVVNGISSAAYGTIDDAAEFTCKVYTMSYDDVIEMAEIVDVPIARMTIKGEDIIRIPSGLTHDFLVMNFDFPEPLIFDQAGTDYAYFVEICGYRDPEHVTFFAPLQSMVPNRHDWSLSFYHCYSNSNMTLTQEMSYVSDFRLEDGRELLTAFAIGLDCCYPWLENADAETPWMVEKGSATYAIRGYYPASAYTTDAPEWLDVDFAGRYTTEVTLTPLVDSDEDRTVDFTISAPGVSLPVSVTVKAGAVGLKTIVAPADARVDIYNLQGILVKARATVADLDSLPAGLYICGGAKYVVR